MKKITAYFILAVTFMVVASSCQKIISTDTGTVKITFQNKVAGNPMVMNAKVYTNPFNETYTISKFRYYVTNLGLNGPGGTATEKNSYHLVDESVPGSLSFAFETEANTFSSLSFLSE